MPSDETCLTCRSSHYTNKARLVLYCCIKHKSVDHKDHCDKFKRSLINEKLNLNPDFIDVLKLLRMC